MTRVGLRDAILIILLAGFAAACSDDPTGPNPEAASMAVVAGPYAATTLIGHAEGGDVDVLADGGSLTLMLEQDGTATGTFIVPGGEEDGSDLTADLDGTWGIQGSTITFDHAADTFIRDVSWTYYDDGTIRTDNAYAEVVLAPDGAVALYGR